MDDTELWKVVWVVLAVVLAAGEIAAPGLILLPFAIGAATAGILAIFEVHVGLQLATFLVASGIAFVALRPMARRLNEHTSHEAIGSGRLVDRPALVIEAITPDHDGMVRIDREEWRAASADGSSFPAGQHVRVVAVRGTRVVVSTDQPQELRP